MDQTDSSVNGGVLIVHQVNEGKHQYDVENVYKKWIGKKMFVRRGDRLMQINGVDLQDLTPEELAEILAEGNPILMVHKQRKKKKLEELPSGDDNTLYPVSKESTMLSFCMEMRREEENEVGEESEKGCPEGDAGQGESEENGEKRDMLIVTMTQTNISIVAGRGCSSESSCQGCDGEGCNFNDVVIVSESSTVTLVPRGRSNFSQVQGLNASIKHVATHNYLSTLCSQKSIYASPNPENMTIYYYKSNVTFRGIPVVLNITGSSSFLRCNKEEERVFLQVETCEKRSLSRISTTDESKLSFLFYMNSDSTAHTKFESALHLGWFIQILNSDSPVTMRTMDGSEQDHTFIFIIQK
ncbi:interleukin-1 family member A [Hippoglossus hippoglossus]|uniref:interleukin-1 family member A n=1 Tax=Hippoglossus hippoglossus TaxID=8267 RepID=UPI00148D3E9C|nr:interleukin-1 family member A [Hippoglossus hippoglossus]